MKKILTVLGSAMLLASCCCANEQKTAASAASERCEYAIVLPSASSEALKRVVDALKKKHAALKPEVVTYDADVTQSRARLAELMPKYTAFVLEPGQGGQPFTVAVSKMCRELDTDPYFDTFWSVVTGYDSAAILALIQDDKPLVIKRSIDCENTVVPASFETQYIFDEDARGKLFIHDAKGDRQEATANDNTAAFINLFKDFKPQMLTTSAHASEVDWQMGYRGPNMVVNCKNGKLMARDVKGTSTEITGDESKVWLAVGNCLLGNIPGTKECMVNAIMRNHGVKQFVGYTVPTWYGRMGWGMLGTFTPCIKNKGKDLTVYATYPGFYNVTEAFHYNNDNIVRDLASGKLSMQHVQGCTHDRDVCVLYGDPAFDARVAAPAVLPYTVTQSVKGNQLTLTIKTAGAGQFPATGLYFTPQQTLLNARIVSQKGNGTFEANERYVFLKPSARAFEKDQTFEVVIEFTK